MPIYEYECLECGTHFDRLQRFGDPQPETCPNGHPQVHRLLSQPAIKLPTRWAMERNLARAKCVRRLCFNSAKKGLCAAWVMRRGQVPQESTWPILHHEKKV